MDAKTEEFLNMLFWTCDMIARPTFRNLTNSFEGWAYRNGFHRQLQRLERQQWIERPTAEPKDRLHRLTEAGRQAALGGRNPEACWGRHWDGLWRIALFDVPEARSGARNRIRHFLRMRGFGYLQNSVWITPNPVTEERDVLADGPVDVESLILLEARPCAGESDLQIASGAWNFAAINKRYQAYQAVLSRCPQRALSDHAAAAAFHRWLGLEREAWLNAMRSDPLLPEKLLPDGYLGQIAWKQRLKVMTEAGKRMRNFVGE